MREFLLIKRSAQIGAVMLGALLCLGGCTDDTPAPGNTGSTTNNTNTNNRNDPKVDPPAGAVLQHVAEAGCDPAQRLCADSTTVGSARLLKVKLLNSDGTVVPETVVKFEIAESDADGVSLTAANTASNAEGIAETTMRAGAGVGTARIVVSTNDANVQPIEFVISVNTKGASSYTVDFAKIGETDPRKIDVFFFDDTTTCAQIYSDWAKERDSDPLTNPSLTAQWTKQGQAQANGTLPIIQLADVQNGTAYTVAARAWSRSNEEVEVSAGCKDGNDPVTNGNPVYVTVPLVKHMPRLVGDYRVVHTFDLRDGLPTSVRTVVDLLGTAITDPGAFVVGCEASDPNCAIPTDGLVNVLINVLPDSGVLGDLKDAIEAFLNNSFSKTVVRDVINDAFENLLNSDNLPSWLGTGVNITQDIYNTLKQFEVVGTIRIKEEPTYVMGANGLPEVDPDGHLTAIWDFGSPLDETRANEQIWEDIVFYWTKDCDGSVPNCGRRELDPNNFAAGDDFVKGSFDGYVVDGTTLHINSHSLTLNYGALIMTVVEKVVLPAIFGNDDQGNPIDSVERMLQNLISCDNVADQVADAVSDSVRGVVKNLCDQLIVQASDGLKSYVTGLVVDGDGRFLIGTKPQGCTIHGPETYIGEWDGKPLPYVESMGKESPLTAQCEWKVEMLFSSEGDPTPMNGTFHGKLK